METSLFIGIVFFFKLGIYLLIDACSCNGIQSNILCFLFFKFFLLKYSWLTMLWKSLLYSKVTQLYHIYILIYILFYYGLSQDSEHSYLCYIVGSSCLSILNVIACINQPQISSPFLSLPCDNHRSVLCKSVSVLQISSFVPCFRFHI